ncbi:MAG: glycoside hydrolase family 25 protein [Clostridia bacterium]|jgi:GH25 family lysozyme M1 (1,4-beta-N-acetylmuramidase)|nr:glycoside hydrolase family 25 protein [Clostridia bacterium]
MTKKGIDVSKWQGSIDWPQVKNAGIEFAMIRLGYGSSNGDKCKTDNYYAANMAGAGRARIQTGVYFYSYARSVKAAEKEAEYVLKELTPYQKQLAYPVAYDLEDESQKGLGKNILTDMVIAFCSVVAKAGYPPAFYCNLDWCRHRLNMQALQEYDLWLAYWAKEASKEHRHSMWQYTNSGNVPGIAGNVDMNVSYKDYAAIKKYKAKREAL